MPINWLAILVALIAQQVLGYCWYTVLFGNAWAAGLGKRPEDLAPTPGPFVLAILGAVLLAIGVHWIIQKTSLHGVGAGALLGLCIGFFITMPPVVVHEAFLGHPALILGIDGAKEVVTALLVGAILGAWPKRLLLKD
jgi:hypothetical protein